ncbi:MAG: hypothetical protein U1F48_10150 [Burkholderiales bacterium]
MAIATKKHKPFPAAKRRVTSNTSVAHAVDDPGIRKKKQGHAKPLPTPNGLHDLARLRVGHLMNLLAISHSTLYARLLTGTIPKPDGRDGKRPYWKTSTVRALLGE